MYILKNALRCITRSKGRNFLIGLIVLLVSASSCIGLSIKQANKTLKKQYADNMEITATLTKSDIKSGQTISLEILKEFATKSGVKNFYYTSNLYFAAGDDIEPLDVAGSFNQNKDFKEKYGDIKSGDKKSTTSTGSTTVTTSEYTESDDESATDSAYLTLNTTIAGIPSDSTASETSTVPSNPNNSNENGDDDTVSKPEDTAPDGHDKETTSSADSTQKNDNKSDKDKQNNSSTTTDGNNQKQDTHQKNEDDLPPELPDNEKGSSADNKNTESTASSAEKNKSDKHNAPPELPDDEKPRDTDGNTEKGERHINRKTYIKSGDTIVNNQFFFNMASMNDFTLAGYTDSTALPQYISTLSVLDLESDEYNCVISKSLAEQNNFSVGDTFTLANPDNSEETYKFSVIGIADTSSKSDDGNTSSNASFADNIIYTSALAVEKIASESQKTYTTAATKNTTKTDTEDTAESTALTPSYNGTYTFSNLTDYNTFSDSLSDEYSVVSTDIENYETSVAQLETLGNYATYFLIVIFAIGGFVLIVINVFSIRDRKYEIGVLTAMGMKKYKVALQFLCELFIVTFIALTIGSTAGAVTSVPVTNKLLTVVNTTEIQEPERLGGDENREQADMREQGSTVENSKEFNKKDRGAFGGFNTYIASVTSATNLTVILQMIGVGLVLTVIASLAAIGFVMRYEPLKILSTRD